MPNEVIDAVRCPASKNVPKKNSKNQPVKHGVKPNNGRLSAWTNTQTPLGLKSDSFLRSITMRDKRNESKWPGFGKMRNSWCMTQAFGCIAHL